MYGKSFHTCMTLPLNLPILYVSIIIITFFGKRLFKITNNKQTKNDHEIALKPHYVYFMLKRHGKGHFHVVSKWDRHVVFVGSV